jgi:alginate O-acetyltransferase complex protein AlgI
MVFSSLVFLLFFLTASLLLHFITPFTFIRNLSLTLFSILFYAWGEPMWIVLLLFSSFFDYGNGLLIERFKGNWKSKLFLIISLIGNLGILLSFKYGDFIWENIDALCMQFGIHCPFPKPGFSLPVGISFYTFQTVSYVIDVYRGEVKAQRNPINFLLFVSLFHQLVAGPIVRYQTIADQINKRIVTWQQFSSGVNRFCFGLFKKVVLANLTGELVEKYLVDSFDVAAGIDAWFGIALFSLQIYFDFSAYSDMAIGLGRMFGFEYLENFRHPYAAKSIGEFYRRWHISLGTFFRDYVYIPLGGNKKHQDRNILIVWLLTGLWHGASWNFVLWGGYFGVLMVLEKYSKNILSRIPSIFKHMYTLVLIIFSRAIFYFVSFTDLFNFIKYHLFDFSKGSQVGLLTDLMENCFLLVACILFCIPWDELKANEGKVFKTLTSSYMYVAPLFNLLFLFISICLLVGASYNPFIYFRF